MKQALALTLIALGCSSPQKSAPQPTGPKVVEIDSKTVACVGEAERTCLRIREVGGAWEPLFDGIEGFEWQEGHRYKLEVRVEKVDNPPADGSSIRYVLVKELEKTAVRDPNVHILEVDNRQVECVGEAERTCLQVRKDGGDWELFYDTIEGFTFEPGHRYKLEVKIEPVAGSAPRYKLVKQLEKKAAQ